MIRSCIGGAGVWLSWWAACRICTKPGVESPAPCKLGMVVLVYNPSAWEVEAGGPEGQSHPLYNKVSLGFMRPCLQKRETEGYRLCQSPSGRGCICISRFQMYFSA